MTISNCVLLIDDRDDFTYLMKFFVEREIGWKVSIATNGKAGIAAAELEQPDAILLDVVMPDLDGLAVYARLKSNLSTSTIAIAFISAKAFIKEIVKSQITEDVLVITKPFNVLELPNQLNKLCGC